MSRQQPKNTLQQDLMLLAKNHYESKTLSKVDMVRRICAFHVLSDWSYFKLRDVAHWLMKEFVEPSLILGDREKLIRFMMSHGKYQLTIDGQPYDAKPGATYAQHYFEMLVNDLLSEIAHMQVIKDGQWLMPFPQPEVDPYITQLLSEVPTEA